MKDLTSSVYTFENLVSGKFRYVDKTKYIWQLLQPVNGHYFLARPRRFGKSLTLSTLKAVFQGKRHLFKGMALESKPYDWKEYPVIHLDLTSCPSHDRKQLNCSLIDAISWIAKKFNINLTKKDASGCFRELILKASSQEKVVILIDEYDKPILDNIMSPELHEIRMELEDFYSVIKTTESYQRFVFLSGVSTFVQLDDFADLTRHMDYATMLGYTQEELEYNFSDYLDHLAKELKIGITELLFQLQCWYGGYRFEKGAPTVYNPCSITNFFSGGSFHNFWFETGTPSFMIRSFLKKDYKLSQLGHPEFDVTELSIHETDTATAAHLLFQAGYLTIADYNAKSMRYSLDFPNLEVKKSFQYIMTSINEVHE